MRIVKAVANRGKNYLVAFSDDGEVVSVSVVFRRGSDYGGHKRTIWHQRTGRQMSLVAKCAAQSAVEVLKGKCGV